MNRYIAIFFIAVIGLMVVSCGEPSEFVIKGEIAGGDAQMIEMIYYANGAMHHELTSAENGKFQLKGTSKNPTLVTLMLSGQSLLANIVVSNGDQIKCKLNINDPLHYEVKGNKPSSLIASFVGDNAEVLQRKDVRAVNQAVASFVAANPDNVASTALMVSYFYSPGYELLADSLLSLIKPQARPQAVLQNFNALLASQMSSQARSDVNPLTLYERRDTVVRFHPSTQSYSLLAFVNDDYSSRDSIFRHMRELVERYPKRRFRTVEISMAADSMIWRNSIESDTVPWWQTWAPGTVAAVAVKKLAVPRYPFFIVTDSLGAQIYRGSSITAARRLITSRLD